MKPDRRNRADPAEEAARWFARMNATSISNAALAEFWEWRRRPENDAAYTRIETIWRSSAALADDPDVQGALAGARRRNRIAPGRAARAGWIAGGAGVAGCAVLAIVMIGFGGSQGYSTKVGESRVVTLADGSRVRLDTDSAITVRFEPRSREIALTRGQAFFDVVHRPDRPLSVRVGDAVIRDIGTRFDVRRDGQAVRVILVEGAVEVGTSTKSEVLSMRPGQQVVVGSKVEAPSPVDLAKATSWTSGQVVFDDLPLSAAAEEMNRYGAHKVRLDSAGAGAIRVSGAFNATDTAAFITAVTRLYDLKAESQPDGSILLVGAGGERPG